MNKFIKKIHHEIEDTKVLMRSVPSTVMVFFCVSVILMNLLANKELLNLGWIALDCGFSVSWMSFLAMDMFTRRFGPKSSIKLSVIAIMFNFMISSLLYLVACVPGNWSQYYENESELVNVVLDNTIGGTWYVVCGSMLAFASGSVVNAFVNNGLGKIFRDRTYRTFAIRSFTSTMLGQFVDNLVFALVVSHVFFGWTMTQVIMCSTTMALFELLAEVIFSPIGFITIQRWESLKIGQEYIEYRRRKNGY